MDSDGAITYPLDVDDLHRRCLGRIELVERVLATFQNSVTDDIEALAQALQDAEAEQVAFYAHRIKGASSAVAARGVQRYAQEIEALAQANRLSDVEVNLLQLKHEYLLVEKLVREQHVR